MSEEKQINRRGFLGVATMAIRGLISTGLGVPAVAYIIGPASSSDKVDNWIRLGSTSKMELGTPTLFKAKVERVAGWIVVEDQLSGYTD